MTTHRDDADNAFTLDVNAVKRLTTRLQNDPRMIDAIRERPIAELAESGILKVADHVDIVETEHLGTHLANHPAITTAAFSTRIPGGGGVNPLAISI